MSQSKHISEVPDMRDEQNLNMNAQQFTIDDYK